MEDNIQRYVKIIASSEIWLTGLCFMIPKVWCESQSVKRPSNYLWHWNFIFYIDLKLESYSQMLCFMNQCHGVCILEYFNLNKANWTFKGKKDVLNCFLVIVSIRASPKQQSYQLLGIQSTTWSFLLKAKSATHSGC